ncbi:MAG: hemolysin III family protein [Clostridia bacterium]|nr:hemolysin III family protein [Clostridia bacterium]
MKTNIRKIKTSILEKRKNLNLPIYSTFEEILSAIFHGIGAILSIAAIVLLILSSSFKAKTIVCVSIYSATLFLLYIFSTMYHALGVNKAKKVFRILDHCSIFILISGTYTPICLLMLEGPVGWILFSIVWICAIVGIVFNAIDIKKFSKLSMICYVAMGWAIIFAIKPLLNVVNQRQLLFLFLGGIFYTVGAAIYAAGKKVKYMHAVWHIFVLCGSICHFFMIFDFIRLAV